MLAATLLLASTPTDLNLQDSTGGWTHPLKGGADASVMVLILDECPIARKYSPTLIKLASEYRSRNVRFFAVHVDPTMTLARAKKHSVDFNLNFPSLLDPKQKLVEMTGADVVPTAVVFDKKGKLVYVGRIDDRFPTLGAQRSKPSREDLKIALEEVLSGKLPSKPRTSSVGCSIPSKTAG